MAYFNVKRFYSSYFVSQPFSESVMFFFTGTISTFSIAIVARRSPSPSKLGTAPNLRKPLGSGTNAVFPLGTASKEPSIHPAFWLRFQWQRPHVRRPAPPVQGPRTSKVSLLLTQACRPHPARRRRRKAGRGLGRKEPGVTRTSTSGPGS